MKEFKLTPGQRSALKLKIIRKTNEDPEFAKRVQKRLDEIAIERENTPTEELIKKPKTTNTKNAVFSILRWLGIIPGAIIGFALANIIMFGLYNIIILTTGDYAILKLVVIDILGAGYAGMAFIAAGYFIAPFFKKEVSIILTIILAITLSLSIFSAIYITYDNLSILTAISSIVGAMYCCFKCIRYEIKLQVVGQK